MVKKVMAVGMVQYLLKIMRTNMDKIKIENFVSCCPDQIFPGFYHLTENESAALKVEIANRLALKSDINGLQLVNTLNSLSNIQEEVSAEDSDFSLKKNLISLNISIPEYVYINWSQYNNIDKIKLLDLDKYFYDIWYPSVDDIDIFDDSLTWILFITHYGKIKFLFFSSPAHDKKH